MNSFSLTQYIVNLIGMLVPSLLQTLYMVSLSTIFALLLGIPLGIILVVTDKGHILEREKLNSVLGFIINITRSLPFIILIIVIFPLSRLIVGTTIGATAAIVPLSIAAAPFVARIVESSLREVSWGMIEASLAMGASNSQIIFKVMLPEALPSLILGVTLTLVNIIGYSAMAGAIGAGGLGDLAIRYGYQRYETDVLIATIIILIILVQLIQSIGNKVSKHFDRR
jgi:D-methionine transport system permease protein